MDDKEFVNEEPIKKGKLVLWLENFWYHYKIHTIAAAFAILVIAVVAVQLTSRPSYDIHIMYAGGKTLTHTASGDDDYTKILASLERVTLDYDENGETQPHLQNLYLPSADEMEKLREEGRADMLMPTIQNDRESLKTNMMLSEHYICFFSEELFREYDKNQNASDTDVMYPFANIRAYTDGDKADRYEYASDRGIYLRSTDFYKMPGISSLPEDTVICIRIRSTVYSSKDNIDYYKSCEQVMKNILSYTPAG